MFGGKILCRIFLVCLLCMIGMAATPLYGESFFDSIHLGYDGADTPGAPRSPRAMSQRLLEDGYLLRLPLVQTGPVYIANVTKTGDQLCLVLDVFTGTILQTFIATPVGFHALNADAPGPGFPGYPPVPDTRFAPACRLTAIVLPPPAPPPKRRRPIVHRRRILKRRMHAPACGPVSVPLPPPKAPPPRPTSAPKPEQSLPATEARNTRICHKPEG